MSSYGLLGVDSERKEHGAIKSGKKELGDVPGAIGPANAKVDGQRLYKGLGSAGMGGAPRRKADLTPGINRTALGSFRVRKRTLKG